MKNNKFRGKKINNRKWVYGYLCFRYVDGRNEEGFIFTDKAQMYDQENCSSHDVLAETVGQFTGLKDINDKEIYEDDIICISDTYTDGILDDGSGPSCEFNHLAKVVFVDGAFGLEIFEDGDDFYRGFWSFISIKDRVGDLDIIVVGNIHDNSELLKKIK